MTEAELIIAVTNEAREIKPVAYKLLWALISLAIQRGSGVVQVSQHWLTLYIGASRAGIALAIDQLGKYVEVDTTSTKVTTFRLPESWLPPQGPLFGGSGPITAKRPRLPRVITKTPSPPPNLPKDQARDQASTCLNSRQVLGNTCLDTRPILPRYQADLAWNLGQNVGLPIRNAHARADQIRSEVSAVTEEYLSIRRAFHSVEILPEQREDAQILAEVILTHRINFDSAARAASRPNRIVLARLLAIAPLEELCNTIHELQAELQPPGKSDMWYFTVLLERIRGIDRTITATVIEQEKAKAQSHESKPSLFDEELVKATVTKVRKLG